MIRKDKENLDTAVSKENEQVDDKKIRDVGRKGKIDDNRVAQFADILYKYRDGKQLLDEKIKDNYEWWKQRHWHLLKGRQVAEGSKTVEMVNKEPEPTTAHLFNCIQNKHADAMDNIPELIFLPVSKDDEQTCSILNKIIPVIDERCKFTKTYSECWYDKLIAGAGIYYVGWNQDLYYGLGDVEIKKVDPLKLFWKPGINNIQESPYTFYVEELPSAEVKELYPFLTITTGNTLALKEHQKAEQDIEQDIVQLVHCYYKFNGKIHYCYFCCGQVIYASENDDRFKDTGYYLHGKHPFVIDSCYSIYNSPFGFSLLDVEKPTQELIDKYTQLTVKNVKDNAAGKKFYDRNSGVNLNDLQDPGKEYVAVNSINDGVIRHVDVKDITANMSGLINNKVEEMNETSGNRDFTQGGTVAGVTSASAIAALQESGSKGSRDLIKNTYEAMKELGEMQIEILRQRYQNTRFFRITGTEEEFDFVEFNNQALLPKQVDEDSQGQPILHTPIFDIKIKAQKQSPFSTMANNEQYLNFFKAGMFNPQIADQALLCVELLEFEGKENLIRKLKENGTLLQTVQELQGQLQQFNNVIQILQQSPQGYMLVQNAMQQVQQQPVEQMNMDTKREGDPNASVPIETNSVGDTQQLHNWQAKKAAEQSKNQAEQK